MLVDKLKQLKADYVAYHAKKSADRCYVYLCLFIRSEFCVRGLEPLEYLITQMVNELYAIVRCPASKYATLDNVPTPIVDSGAEFKRLFDASYPARYDRRIYFLDQWIAELETLKEVKDDRKP